MDEDWLEEQTDSIHSEHSEQSLALIASTPIKMSAHNINPEQGQSKIPPMIRYKGKLD